MALNREDRFRFLYLAVKQNEHFILAWIKENYIGDLDTREESEESVRNAFDYLGKLIRPGIRKELVLDKELMLDGMAEDLLWLSQEVCEMWPLKKTLRAGMVLAAIEALYTCIIDCFFSPLEFDEDASSFHVILLSALGNDLHGGFMDISPEAVYEMSWNDLEKPDKKYLRIKVVIVEFMGAIFYR